VSVTTLLLLSRAKPEAQVLNKTETA